ncbi:MAG TPA: aldo/keto reductase, partial [Pirellulales bacterium]|nr:aldo/keto reductase [Pirellulales bacterium]
RRSLTRLKTDAVDLLFLHAPAADLQVLNETDAVEALQELKTQGLTRAIGFSAKTPPAALQALDWADALMVEYHLHDQTMADVIQQAAQRGVAIIVKKALASGTLPTAEALEFVLQNLAVASVVIGTLNLDHMRANLAIAEKTRRGVTDSSCRA